MDHQLWVVTHPDGYMNIRLFLFFFYFLIIIYFARLFIPKKNKCLNFLWNSYEELLIMTFLKQIQNIEVINHQELLEYLVTPFVFVSRIWPTPKPAKQRDFHSLAIRRSYNSISFSNFRYRKHQGVIGGTFITWKRKKLIEEKRFARTIWTNYLNRKQGKAMWRWNFWHQFN